LARHGKRDTMIYVDDPFEWHSDDWRKGWWCHMWSDHSSDELIAFAATLGLEERWLQHRGGERWREHFDLRLSLRVLAVQSGATEIRATAFIRMMKERHLVLASSFPDPNERDR
jgi:Protein of unknown function (DUF4031)